MARSPPPLGKAGHAARVIAASRSLVAGTSSSTATDRMPWRASAGAAPAAARLRHALAALEPKVHSPPGDAAHAAPSP
eukprot:9577721-Alexandrium_andersonii.AAC.1